MIRRSLVITGLITIALPAPAWAADGPTAVVRDAERLQLPGVSMKGREGAVDCNTPAHWDGDTMYVFMSAGHPWRSHGPDVARLSKPSVRVTFNNEKEWKQGGRWIEATLKDPAGPLYMWYHNEPRGVCPHEARRTAPRIGGMVSNDNGLHWRDLDILIEAPADSKNCDTPNMYFFGGNGDFCVNADQQRRYVYVFNSTYHRDVAEQGVAVARIAYENLGSPKGKVFKWHKGEWNEPGIGGHVTPIFRTAIDWHDARADAFWGPSVHWNTHLKQWVMLLNRAKDKNWTQEGIYVSFNADIAKPDGWSRPVKILEPKLPKRSNWYPQVIGSDTARHETDKLAGRSARLFVSGVSNWEIVFLGASEGE